MDLNHLKFSSKQKFIIQRVIAVYLRLSGASYESRTRVFRVWDGCTWPLYERGIWWSWWAFHPYFGDSCPACYLNWLLSDVTSDSFSRSHTSTPFGGMKMCTSPLGFLQPHRVGLAGFDYCDLTVAKVALVLTQPNTMAFLLNIRPSHLHSHAT